MSQKIVNQETNTKNYSGTSLEGLAKLRKPPKRSTSMQFYLSKRKPLYCKQKNMAYVIERFHCTAKQSTIVTVYTMVPPHHCVKTHRDGPQ